jgi:hypothetical protein
MRAAAGLQVDQWRVAFAADPDGADAPLPRGGCTLMLLTRAGLASSSASLIDAT